MSIATLERAILRCIRILFKNPKVKLADIAEWSTSEKQVRDNAQPDEKVFWCPDPGVWAAVKAEMDKSGK